MNDIGSRTDITKARTLLINLGNIAQDAASTVPDSDYAPIAKQLENIRSSIKDAKLSGDSYASLMAKGSPLDRATLSSNSNIRYYAQQIKNTLDDAMEAEAAPEDVAALKQARFQYKNLMTVRNLAAKANVEGEINPNLLNGAVNTNFKNRAFQGAGDLGELAQIGQTFMKESPNSFTADRLADRLKKLAPSFLGGAAFGDMGLAFTHPVLATKLAAGVGVGAVARGVSTAVKRAANLSPEVRNRFINNALSGRGSLPPIEAPVNLATPAAAIAANNFFQNNNSSTNQQGNK